MLPDQGAPTRGNEVECDSVMVTRFEKRSEQMPRMKVVRWSDVISILRLVDSGEKERAFLSHNAAGVCCIKGCECVR